MKVTIKEIAEAAGVSITTVSQILNNKGSRFSEKTREKVVTVAQALQYQPDYFARGMVTGQSKTIGMIVPDVTDLFFASLIEGVEAYLHALGYMIILCNSNHQPSLEESSFKKLISRSVEGIVLATPNQLPSSILEHPLVVQKKVPLVLIDMGINQRTEGQLLVTEYEGVSKALEYLLSLGHRQIAFLKEEEAYYSLGQRYQAYEDSLRRHQYALDPSLVVSCPLTIVGGYQGVQQLLIQSRSKWTALVCSNDQMAIGAYQALYEAGLRVPEDVSVIGFDGIEVGRYLAPSLTTVEQPIFDIGFTAGRFILDAVHHPFQRIPNHRFRTKLVKRASVQDLTK